jgi:hypothetical protein
MKRTAILVALVAFLMLASLVLARGQTRGAAPAGPGYTLSWWTVDGGGTTLSTGGGYTLGGTAGQPDAGVLTGGGYTLASGFWGGGAVEHRIYLPLVVRNH